MDLAQPHQVIRPIVKQIVREQIVHGRQILRCHRGPAVQDLALPVGIAHPARPLRKSQTDPAGSRPGLGPVPPG